MLMLILARLGLTLPASANSHGRSDSWQSNVNISSASAFRVVPVDDEVQSIVVTLVPR